MDSDISSKLDVLDNKLDWESILEDTKKYPYTVSELLDYVFSYMDGLTGNCTIDKDIDDYTPVGYESVADKINSFSELIENVSDYTTIKYNTKYMTTVLKPLQAIYNDINSVVEIFKGDTKFSMRHNKYESLKVVFNKLGRYAIPTANNTKDSLKDIGDILKQYRLVPYGYENFPKDRDYFEITDINDILFCLPVDINNKSLRIRVSDILNLVPGYGNSSCDIDYDDIYNFVKDVFTKDEIQIFKKDYVQIKPHSLRVAEDQRDYDIYLTPNGKSNRDLRLRNNNNNNNNNSSINRFNNKHIPLGFWHPLLASSEICGMIPKRKSVSNRH